NDALQRLQARAAVHQRRVLELERDRLEESHQEPDRERHRERRVDEHHRPGRVLQPEPRDHARERQEEQGRRHDVGEEDADAEPLAHPAGKTGQRVAGRHGEHERDRDDEEADEERVAEPRPVARVVEEEAPAVERGVEGPRLRRVEDLVLALQRRDRHPHEREREHERERDRDAVGEEAPARLHHETSAGRAKISIPIATAASTGSRKSEIAAPWPRAAPSMPVWYEDVVSTSVELNGPPFVRIWTTAMSVAV